MQRYEVTLEVKLVVETDVPRWQVEHVASEAIKDAKLSNVSAQSVGCVGVHVENVREV